MVGRKRMPDATAAVSLDELVIVMGRVRRNAELLAQRLAALGWKPLTGSMVGKPRAPSFREMAEVERIGAGSLPLALRVFWEIVGSLDFVWDYQSSATPPDLFGGVSLLTLDPLYLEGPEMLSPALVEWREMIAAGDMAPTGPFCLELSPDDFHKANVSGGPAYGVALPTHDADPMFGGIGFSMRLTEYLQFAFRWGGFPGLAKAPATDRLVARLGELTRGFEPI